MSIATDHTLARLWPTGRLHRSTWAWLIFVFALLVIAILPGSHGEPIWRYHLIEHGWPFTYVVRDARYPYQANLWTVPRDVVDFYPLALSADILISAVLLAAVAIWRESRARRRASMPRRHSNWRWQFSLRRLIMATTAAGVLVALGVEIYRYVDARQLNPNSYLPPPLYPSFLRPLVVTAQRLNAFPSRLPLYEYDPPTNDIDVARLRYLTHRYPDSVALHIYGELHPAEIEGLSKVRHVRALASYYAKPESLAAVAQFDRLQWLFVNAGMNHSSEVEVTIDKLLNSRPVTLRGLYLFGKKHGDEDLARIARAPYLEQLHLTWTAGDFSEFNKGPSPVPDEIVMRYDARWPDRVRGPLTDEGLRPLAGLKSLQSLQLEGTQIRGPGLAHLHALPRLRHLAIENAPLDDAGVAYLNGCHALLSLSLKRCDMASLQALDWRQLPRLRRLNLSATPMSIAEVRRLRCEHPQIEIEQTFVDWLDNYYRKSYRKCWVGPYSAEQWHLLSQHTDLREIYWEGANVTDSDLAFVAQLNELTTLTLSNTNVGDDFVPKLAAVTTLTELRLDGTHVTSGGWQPLAYHPRLEYLCLDASIVDQTLIHTLQTMCNLNYIFVVDRDDSKTQQAVALLRANLPGVEVDPD